jgi:hypothetical protein
MRLNGHKLPLASFLQRKAFFNDARVRTAAKPRFWCAATCLLLRGGFVPTVHNVGVALQEGVLVMEEEDSSASNPLANPMMDPMNMVYAFHRRYVVGPIDFFTTMLTPSMISSFFFFFFFNAYVCTAQGHDEEERHHARTAAAHRRLGPVLLLRLRAWYHSTSSPLPWEFHR